MLIRRSGLLKPHCTHSEAASVMSCQLDRRVHVCPIDMTSCFCMFLWHDITLLSVLLKWHHLFIVCEFFPAFYTLFNTMAKKITKHICSTVFDSCEWLPISMDFFLTSRSNDRQYWVYTTEIIAEMTILCILYIYMYIYIYIYILCIHAVLSYEDVCARGRSLAHG